MREKEVLRIIIAVFKKIIIFKIKTCRQKRLKIKSQNVLTHMNESQLQSAWLMVKELCNQEQYIKGKETKTVNERIAILHAA